MCINAQIPTNGLVAYYPFNGNANDESGNGNNASEITSNVSFVNGIKGQATKFGGFNSPGHIHVPNSTSLKFTNLASFVYWVRLDNAAGMDGWGNFSANGNQCAFAKSHDRRGIYNNMGYTSKSKLYSNLGENYSGKGVSSRGEGISGYKLGSWIQIAYTFSSTSSTLYVNGVKDSTVNTPINFNISNSQDLYFGKYSDYWYPLNGALDEFRIYNRTLSSNEVSQIYNSEKPATTYSTVQPQISLSTGVVELNGKVVITGKGFTPLGNVKIILVSNCGGTSNDIMADSNGNFTYMYTAPSGIVSSTGCEVIVYAKDVKSDIVAPVKTFKITVPVTPNTASINIINPKGTYKTNQPITVTWTEMLYKTASGVTYPFDKSTGYRTYKYTIQYKTSETGNWQTAQQVQGSDLFDKVLIKNIQFSISEPTNYCQVRVIDYYSAQSQALSEIFAVEPSILNTQLVWDYSFPSRNGSPVGVAADGVARIYLKVKLDKPTQKATVTVKLSADGISENSIDLLGKIIAAKDTIKYSLEGDKANSIIASNNISDPNGYIWFWYVAPENFTRGGMSSPFAYASERTVNANISVSYEGGSTLPDVLQKIKIVRPPLMMVHGLNSDNKCFDNFHYNRSGVGDIYFTDRLDNENPTPQPQTTLFPIHHSINLRNNQGLYMENALQMISDYPTDDNLKGNLNNLRIDGYAANQVDYVCHSMGGAVLRTVIEKCSNNYLGIGGTSKYPYQNYSKGFVHKAITIDTPHNGSPVADALTEYIPHCPTNMLNPINSTILNLWKYNNKKMLYLFQNNYGGFFIPKYEGKNKFGFELYSFDVSDAVKNLQVQGIEGVQFGITNVKNHLIAGDVDLSLYDAQTIITDNKWFKMFLIVNAIKGIGAAEESVLLMNLVKDKTSEAYNFMNQYSESKGFANYFTDGDLVVPLSSQLAGLSETSTTISKYGNSGKDPFDAHHLKIIDRPEVGNRVLELLNSDINGELFADNIPANTVHKSNGSSSSFAPKKAKQETINTTYVNTNKVQIVSPIRNTVLYADSTVKITYNLKDTANLSYASYSFQGNFDVSLSKAYEQSNSIQINTENMGKQTVFVSAVYSYPDSTVTYIDTLSVNVQTMAQLIDFQVSPSIMYLYKGVKYHPTLTATFSNGLINIPYNSPDLVVEINNPQVVSYNQIYNSFEGLDTLTTFARISYRGISDTIYFNVLDTVTQRIPDNYNGLLNNRFSSKGDLDVKTYPNPFTETISFEYTLPKSGKAKLEVYSVFGIKVKEFDFGIQSEGLCTINISMKDLIPGIYIYKLTSGMSVQNGSVVKL